MNALMHASCVSIEGKGVLLLGPSGAGKSDLALRLIDAGALLVADDQVALSAEDGALLASPPPRIQGRIELRGIGISEMDFKSNVRVLLVVQLEPREAVERMPEHAFFDCMGVSVPLLLLHAFDSSTEAKIRHYLRRYC